VRKRLGDHVDGECVGVAGGDRETHPGHADAVIDREPLGCGGAVDTQAQTRCRRLDLREPTDVLDDAGEHD